MLSAADAARAVAAARRLSAYVDDRLARHACASLDPLTPGQLDAEAAQALAAATSDDDARSAIRLMRHRHTTRIAIRDLGGLAELAETLADTSDLADALLRHTVAWAAARLALRHGRPMGAQSGDPQEMIVLAMGKLGGHELNFSSDIDLIFVYPEDGETDHPTRPLANEEFFTKLGRMVIGLFTDVTADGFAYRVDMRLRPFGDSGQLASSFAAFETYYQTHGRPWERYAMIKARAVTGNPAQVARLEAMLHPFIFRRYVDFSMLDSLRDLKRMITDQVNRKETQDDLKLGSGGIREIEFVVQSFQLVHGGRDRLLDGRSLLPTLATLGQRHYLEADAVAGLAAAYRFLRMVENRVQMREDRQTHRLPLDPHAVALLAEGMGFADSESFLAALDKHRRLVAVQFDQVLGRDEPADDDGLSRWRALWNDPEADWHGGVDDPAEWRRRLVGFRLSRNVATQSDTDRQRLDRTMPEMLAAVDHAGDGVETLARVLDVLEAVARRSVYLVLLHESASARHNLVRLCAASPWLAETLAQRPALFDQLLDADDLFSPLGRADIAAELAAQLGPAPSDERLMDVLRLVKEAQVLKIAACDLIGGMPLMKVSDHLTWLAEAVVDTALNHLWEMTKLRHGLPGGWTDPEPPVMVAAFGKLGGLELGYGSDLDVVFLSASHLSPLDMSAGPHRLDGTIYVTRLCQKLIRVLATPMPTGIAYEVDSALRPHGGAGMLVTPLGDFFRYEREQAWVWEHQALLRARAIAGHPALCASFERQRRDFLCQPRDHIRLRTDVLEMRQRMRINLDRSDETAFDIKQGPGGMIDMEFLVQYLVLAHAYAHPALVAHSDNIRQLAALAQAGVLTADEAQSLSEQYRSLRGMGHRLALAKRPAKVSWDSVAPIRNAVQDAWVRHLGS